MRPEQSSTSSISWSNRIFTRLSSYRAVGSGLLVCVTIALASTFIADHYGGPTLLYALLFGMSLHFLSEEGRCLPGIEFASRTILRLGVMLLGARMTLAQVGELGFGPVLMVVAAVVRWLFVGHLQRSRYLL